MRSEYDGISFKTPSGPSASFILSEDNITFIVDAPLGSKYDGIPFDTPSGPSASFILREDNNTVVAHPPLRSEYDGISLKTPSAGPSASFILVREDNSCVVVDAPLGSEYDGISFNTPSGPSASFVLSSVGPALMNDTSDDGTDHNHRFYDSGTMIRRRYGV